MKQTIREELDVPQGVAVKVSEGAFSIKGPKGEVSKTFKAPRISSKVEGSSIIFESVNATQREKKLIMTFIAHLKNILRGVQGTHVYKLKVCASHFPMTVTVKGNVLEIKNFIGETVPRHTKIPQGVSIKVDGQIISVEGTDKEIVSQAAVQIEQTTKRPGFDKRVFQDGIYLIEKDGKTIKA